MQAENPKKTVVGIIQKPAVSNKLKAFIKPSVKERQNNSALLFDIEGNYAFEDDGTGCRINLKLYNLNGQLKYRIKTNTRVISSDAKIDLNEKKDGYYITFKNIEWSEDSGATGPDDETSDQDLPLPQEIEGVLYRDEIIIQNYGNAMNYYVKLGECGVKYIHLTREEKRKK